MKVDSGPQGSERCHSWACHWRVRLHWLRRGYPQLAKLRNAQGVVAAPPVEGVEPERGMTLSTYQGWAMTVWNYHRTLALGR